MSSAAAEADLIALKASPLARWFLVRLLSALGAAAACHQQARIVTSCCPESLPTLLPCSTCRRELSSEVEGSASVFKLHYEELLRKDKEISDLQVGAARESLEPSAAVGGAGRVGAGPHFCVRPDQA